MLLYNRWELFQDRYTFRKTKRIYILGILTVKLKGVGMIQLLLMQASYTHCSCCAALYTFTDRAVGYNPRREAIKCTAILTTIHVDACIGLLSLEETDVG